MNKVYHKIKLPTIDIFFSHSLRFREVIYKVFVGREKVLDISLMYAFDSHEGFTGAYTQLFDSTPITIKKYMTSYRVPEYVVPITDFSRKNGNKLQGNLHRLVYKVLTESIKETKESYCTEIEVIIAADGTVKFY